MSFLAPGYLLAGAAAVALVALLHLLAWRRPPETPFPTARFVPDRPARAVSRALRPTDLALFALRALALLLVSAAFARPVPDRADGVRRIVLADRSRAVGSVAELNDSLRAVLREGDVVVAFDTVAHALAGDQVDATFAVDEVRQRPAALSAALVTALRAARGIARDADSLELVIVSPFAREALDPATRAIRAQWGGRARLVPIAIRPDSAAPIRVATEGSLDDPVLAALERAGLRDAAGRARLSRDPAARAAAPGDSGTVLIEWPRSGAPAGWESRTRVDTIGGIASGDVAVVAPFVRRWRMAGDTTRRVIARWADGLPAADEAAAGSGCVRRIAIDVPAAGDLALRPAFVALVRRLTTMRCGGERDLAPMRDDQRRMLAGEGPLLATSALVGDTDRSWLVPLLLASALLLLLVELLLRRQRRTA
jgi:hypothetical protein